MEPVERLLHYCRSTITTAWGITSTKPITTSVVNQTLRNLINKHDLLTMCIRKSADTVPHFCKMDSDVLDNIEAVICLDEQWESAVEKTRDPEVFDSEKGPLWKCIFLPNASICHNNAQDLQNYSCVIIFVLDHAITDGRGTVQILNDFITILDQNLLGKALNTEFSPPIQPLEYFLEKSYPLSFMQRTLVLLGQILCSFEFVVKFIIWVENTWFPNYFIQQFGLERKKNPKSRKTTQVHLQILNKQETRNVIVSCKKNGCSVQGALQAASTIAMLQIFNENRKKSPKRIKTIVPIDMRRRLTDFPLDSQSLSFSKHVVPDVRYGSMWDFPRCNASDFWKLARDSTRAIHLNIERNEFLYPRVYIIPPLLEQHFDLLRENLIRDDTMLLVNSLGKFSLPHCNVKLTGFLFGTCGTDFGPIFVTYAATIDNILSITHSYHPHVTSEESSRQYICNFESILKSIIKEDENMNSCTKNSNVSSG